MHSKQTLPVCQQSGPFFPAGTPKEVGVVLSVASATTGREPSLMMPTDADCRTWTFRADCESGQASTSPLALLAVRRDKSMVRLCHARSDQPFKIPRNFPHSIRSKKPDPARLRQPERLALMRRNVLRGKCLHLATRRLLARRLWYCSVAHCSPRSRKKDLGPARPILLPAT